jgi:hypothetical protein
MTVVKQFPDAIAYDVVPGTLWYLAATNGGADAVEIDPAMFAERQRIAVPADVAGTITIAPDGNPWIWNRRRNDTSVAVVDAKAGTVGTPYELPYDAIGGINPVAGSMWALPAANTTYGSQIHELGPSGPTGRVERLDQGLDPDGAVVGFGSIWIPWEGPGKLYRYPVDGLAP